MRRQAAPIRSYLWPFSSSEPGTSNRPARLQRMRLSGKAYFAGGCFWCMEEVFEKVEGVLSATSGYMGGTVANPTYEEVSAGRTGHAESVEVVYDPAKVSYQKASGRLLAQRRSDHTECTVLRPWQPVSLRHFLSDRRRETRVGHL